MAAPTVAERLAAKQNNFDLIRFVAAASVMLSHAYTLSTGVQAHEPLVWLSGGQNSIGGVCVLVFFATSGFLITMSFQRAAGVPAYFRARALRIFPALVLAVCSTAFVLGPAVTSLPLRAYFAAPGTYAYLSAVLLKPLTMYLPGVFVGNAYTDADGGFPVNGSLWTIRYEVLCYVLVALLGRLRLLTGRAMGCLYLACALAIAWHPPVRETVYDIPYLFCFFAAGACAYLGRERLPVDGRLAAGAALALGLCGWLGWFNLAFSLFGTYLVLYAAFTPRLRCAGFAKHGDFSYGIYLFAYPVQQAVVHAAGGRMAPWLNLAIAFPLALALAALSWHLVEKNALKLKRRPRPEAPPAQGPSARASGSA